MNKIILCLLINTSVFALNLNSGSDFYSTTLKGAIGIVCDNGMNMVTKMYRCEKDQLLPVMNDYIVSEELDADKIEITYKDRKGKTRTKSLKFNSKLQRTSKEVSLWKKNLWNKPILNAGENIIKFKAYKSGKLMKEVEQSIFVKTYSESYCGAAQLRSRDLQDCYSMSRACELFYSAVNYCQ